MRSFKGLMTYVRSLVASRPGEALQQEVSQFASIFDKIGVSCTPLTFFIFHVDLPRENQVISYCDVHHDHGLFDYRALIDQLVWSIRTFNGNARILFVTNEGNAFPDIGGVTVVRLPLKPAEIMFERVKAMTAFTQSTAFSNNTVFLDSDAFPNRDLRPVFASTFNVCVTYRTRPGFMPINEGVLFVSAKKEEMARAFFDAYLGTYETLIRDYAVKQYYGDIKRWRGGQLSLSAISPQPPIGGRGQVSIINGIKILAMPCTTHNFTPLRPASRRGTCLDDKYVLHLKGDKKRFFESLIAYQRFRVARLRRAEISSGSASNLVSQIDHC